MVNRSTTLVPYKSRPLQYLATEYAINVYALCNTSHPPMVISAGAERKLLQAWRGVVFNRYSPQTIPLSETAVPRRQHHTCLHAPLGLAPFLCIAPPLESLAQPNVRLLCLARVVSCDVVVGHAHTCTCTLIAETGVNGWEHGTCSLECVDGC